LPALWIVAHPVKKTNNENNANEFFIFIASSFFSYVSIVTAVAVKHLIIEPLPRLKK